jgi:hypothetical protein
MTSPTLRTAATGASTVDAFLLSREWRDGDRGVEIVLWGRAVEGPVRARLTEQAAVMFVPRSAPSCRNASAFAVRTA